MNGDETNLTSNAQSDLVVARVERPDVREAGTPIEYLSQRGAMQLARRLQAHWSEKGSLAARFWVVPIDERFSKVGSYQLYRVECNFVNGLPPDWPLNSKK